MSFFGKVKLDAADKLFSLYIRKRAGNVCEVCHRSGENVRLTCSHFFGRRKESTRFDPENCEALCISCHAIFETEKGVTTGTIGGVEIELPRPYRSWKIKKLGLYRFGLLEMRSHTHAKKDRKMSLLYVKALMADLEKGKPEVMGARGF
jgi:hypothetical protein